jgi:spermidine synthase
MTRTADEPDLTADDSEPIAEEAETATDETRQVAILRRVRMAVLVSTCLSGAAALIYEVAWTRELSLVFGSTVYAVSTMLAAFMAGLSLGGYLGGRRADKPGTNLVRDLATVELGIGVFGALSIPLMRVMPVLYYTLHHALNTPGWTFFLVQLVLSFLVMLVPTTLMGATFPIVSKINTGSDLQVGRSVGDVYSINTLGSIFGSLAAGFLLVPILGVRGAIVTAAVLNCIVSVGLLLVARDPRWHRHILAATVLLACMAFLVVTVSEPTIPLGFANMGRYNSYQEYQWMVSGTKVLFSKESAYSHVQVTQSVDGQGALYNGGFIEGSNAAPDRATTYVLADLPYAYATNPRNALVIGLGTGYTSKAMLDLPLDSLDTVEINPAVPTASRYFVGDALVNNPKWHLRIDDARQFLLMGDKHYDLISSEPSWPLSESVAHLFTKEFFDIASNSLNDGGVFVQWLPQYLLQRDDFMMLYRTFHTTFPDSSAWTLSFDGKQESDLFLVGVKAGGEKKSPEQVKALVERQLAKWGMPNVKVSPMASPQTLKQAVTDSTIPLNTDDRPLLEFRIVSNLIKNL